MILGLRQPEATLIPCVAVLRDGSVRGVMVRVPVSILKADAPRLYHDAEGVYRWITIHSDHDGKGGTPVKIRESRTNPGVWHVVGGAGGKLNYMTLHRVSSPEEAKAKAEEHRKIKRDAEKARREEEKVRMAKLTKEERKSYVTEKQIEQQQKQAAVQKVEIEMRSRVAEIAQAAGWAPEEWQFDKQREKLEQAGTSHKRIEQLERDHLRRMITKCNQVVESAKRQVLIDHEARAEAGLADLPLRADDPDTIAVTDLIKDKVGKGPGYRRDIGKQSEEALTAQLADRDVDRLEAEVTAAKDLMNPELPATVGKLVQLQTELHAAKVIRDNAAKSPEELQAREAELKSALEAVEKERKSYLPRLLELKAKVEDPARWGSEQEQTAAAAEFDTLGLRHATDLDRIATLQEQLTDNAIMQGKPAPAFKGERKELSARRAQEREDAVYAEQGVEGIERRRAYIGMLQEGLNKYRKEVKTLRDAGAYKPPEVETKKPIQNPAELSKLLRAGKALQMLKKDLSTIKNAEKLADDERMFGKALFVETRNRWDDEALNAAVQKDTEQALAEQRTRTFLNVLDDAENDRSIANLTADQKRDALQRHLSAGSYNAINNAAQVLTGAPVLPRDVAEVLGPAAAAQLLARTVQQGKSREEIKAIAEGIQNFHLKNHLEASEEAVDAAQQLYDQVQEIELGASNNPADLAAQQELNARRVEMLSQARAILGRTLGELEAMAQLGSAMTQKINELHVNLGPIAPEAAIRQVRALGLDRGDYTVDTDGVNRFVTVHASGLDKLVTPVDPADVALTDHVAAIKAGEFDEPDYIPPGMIKRPATWFNDPRLKAERFGEQQQQARPLNQWGQGRDLREDVEDHIGARIADGEDPNDVLPDILGRLRDIPEEHRVGVVQMLDELMPATVPQMRNGKPVMKRDKEGNVVTDANGQPVPATMRVKADFHRDALNNLAENYVTKTYGSKPDVAAFHAQSLDLSTPEAAQKTSEAMYRALAQDPRAVAAFKPAGELGRDDQRSLRHYFDSHIAKNDPKAGTDSAGIKARLEELGAEPEKETGGLFGKQTNPAWSEWNLTRSQIVAQGQEQSTNWSEYVETMGGTTRAYAAIQDRLRHDFIRRFSQSYAQMHGEPLKVGKQAIRGADRHLGFVDPAEREKIQKEQRDLIDSARNRVQGRYAEGSVKEKVDRLLEQQEIDRQNQIGFFGVEKPTVKELNAGERVSLGMRAENQIAGLMANVGQNLATHPGQGINLRYNLSMSGKDALRQRTIKGFLAAKRVNAALGVGTGKTSVSIGAFTAAASDPSTGVKRSIFAVPSHVQGQFHGELAKTIKPGTFNWHAKPGADFNERMDAHRNPDNHIMVTTHQGLRDDMVKLLADKWGITPGKATERFVGLDRKARAAAMREAWNKAGIDYQASFVDEGHNLLDRRGKEDSLLSGVLQAVSDNTSHFMSMSGDPAKNDVSEIRSQLDKIYTDGRYGDEQAWHKRYGLNTTASREALKREVGGRFFMGSITPPVKATQAVHTVDLHPDQQRDYDAALGAFDRARTARMKGTLDVEAIKELSPNSFANAPAAEHEDIARRLSTNLGIIRDAALNRVINLAPPEKNGKIQKILERLKEHPPGQKPHVIFARNLQAVKHIEAAVKAAGHRVVTLTGEHAGAEKDKRKAAFQPPDGKEPTADVFVLSDAGATGLNLQRGQTLIHYDTPHTAMVHEQRSGRIFRNGQKQDVDLIDYATKTPFEQAARQRMGRKMDLRDIFLNEGGDDTGLAAAIAQAKEARGLTRTPPTSVAA